MLFSENMTLRALTTLPLSRMTFNALLPVMAGHMAPTLREPDPREIIALPHFSNLSVGDPLVITPWLTNHNGDLETSLGLVTPRAGPQLRA